MKKVKHTKIVKGGKMLIRVEYNVTHLASNSNPYIHITADIGEKGVGGSDYLIDKYGNRYGWTTSGCCHDEIAKYFPEYKDLIEVHGNEADTGQPMYAKENGWYFYEKDGFKKAAEYLQLSEEQGWEMGIQMTAANETFEQFSADTAPNGPRNEAVHEKRRMVHLKAAFFAYVDSLAPHYKAKMDALIEKYDLGPIPTIVDGKPVYN